jgi:hypothetical protein
MDANNAEMILQKFKRQDFKGQFKLTALAKGDGGDSFSDLFGGPFGMR